MTEALLLLLLLLEDLLLQPLDGIQTLLTQSAPIRQKVQFDKEAEAAAMFSICCQKVSLTLKTIN